MRQILTADPVGMDRKSCTVYWNIVYWRDFLPIPTGSAIHMYLAQYPHLPFCVLIYIQYGTIHSSMVLTFLIKRHTLSEYIAERMCFTHN